MLFCAAEPTPKDGLPVQRQLKHYQSYPKVTSESSGWFQFEDGQPASGRLTVSLWVIQKRQPTRKCNE